jgi:formylglycine-generating enzyme required for sulfatase activity
MRPQSFPANRVITPAALLLLASCSPPPRSAADEVAVPAPTERGPAPTLEVSAGTCPTGMVLLPAATFKMGATDADDDAMPGEMPQHAATVAAFCLAKTETTVEEYEACVGAGSCTAADVINNPQCNKGVSGRSNHPMNCVDFAQATAYCKAQGARLPTEEEWEYAARGAAGRKYPWGSAAPDTTRLNACDKDCTDLIPKIDFMFETSDGWASTAPTGSFPKGATPEGLQDMAGNVAEWTSSRDCPYPEKSCAEENRIVRGGGWDTMTRASVSGSGRTFGGREPSLRVSGVGFRCARTP